MAKYMLTGINDEEWRRFKAFCDLQGVTLKDMLTEHITAVVKAFDLEHHTPKFHYHAPKRGGKKK